MFAVILKCIPVYSRAEPTPDWLSAKDRLLVTSECLTLEDKWWGSAPCGSSGEINSDQRPASCFGKQGEYRGTIHSATQKSLSHIYVVAFSTLRTSSRPWRQWTDRWTVFITPSLRRTASCSPRSRSEKDTPVRPNTLQSFWQLVTRPKCACFLRCPS